MPPVGHPPQGDLGDEGGEEPRAHDQPELGLAQPEFVPEVAEQGDDRAQRAHAQSLGQVVGEQSGLWNVVDQHVNAPSDGSASWPFIRVRGAGAWRRLSAP